MCSCGADRGTGPNVFSEGANASECFHSAFAKVGTTVDLNYEHTFEEVSEFKTKESLTVQGQTVFDGRAANHASGPEWIVMDDQPRPYDKIIYYHIDQVELNYYEFGFERFATRGDAAYHRKVVYRPALERRFDLEVGESYTQFYSIYNNMAYDSPDTGSETEKTQVDTIHVRRFDGFEVLALPVGEFSACKFSDEFTYIGESSDVTTTAFEWYDIETGVLIRREYEDLYSGTQTTVFIGGAIDGDPVE